MLKLSLSVARSVFSIQLDRAVVPRSDPDPRGGLPGGRSLEFAENANFRF
ncbi:hypothetical protein JJD41_23260 [Oxynema sp. CENA135]|nr:hypothetical protein [Oxynema sp. CENA135]MBK4732762.1 hypothetical protein [Oxynema sp. CENA135]